MFTIKLGKAKFKITLNAIIILLYFWYCSIPTFRFRVDEMGNYMLLLLVVPYIVYFTFIKGVLRKKSVVILTVFIILAGVLYSVLTAHYHTPYPILSNVITFSGMLIPVAMYLVLQRKNDIGEINFAFLGMTAILGYLLFQTISNSVNEEDIVHLIANMNYENFDKSKVAMSMDQSFALVPIACLMVVILFETRTILIRMFAGVGVITIIVALFAAQFTSAILIFLLCVCIYMIKSRKGFSKVLIILLMIIFIFVLPSLLLIIARNIDSDKMSVRLTEVATFLQSGDITGYNMTARIDLYKRGIIAFLKSPLWGNYSLGFDPHSSFLQFAADIGFWGLLIFIYTLKVSKQRIIDELGGKTLGFFIAYSALIITGLINPIHSFPTMFLAVFCYVPLGLRMFNGKDK